MFSNHVFGFHSQQLETIEDTEQVIACADDDKPVIEEEEEEESKVTDPTETVNITSYVRVVSIDGEMDQLGTETTTSCEKSEKKSIEMVSSAKRVEGAEEQVVVSLNGVNIVIHEQRVV